MLLHAKEEQIHIAAILPAAGSSMRMGTNKLLLPLHGIPVLAHTLLAFEQCPFIESIVIVCREQDIMPYRQLAAEYSCTKVQYIVRGGQTRTESVLAGIEACANCVDFVAIHDGARPLVSQAVIQAAITEAIVSGAAAPVVSMKDSIKRVSGGKIVADIARDQVAAVQTPQVFRRTLIRSALKESLANGALLTDDCAAVERIGVSVSATPGSYRNIKITTPEDIPMAEALFDQEE